MNFCADIQYRRTFQPQTNGSLLTTPYGQFTIDVPFDFGCLQSRNICLNGFILSLWLQIINFSTSRPVFQNGDCTTENMAAEGFCIHYFAGNTSLIVKDVYQSTAKTVEFPVPGNSEWMNVMVVFSDNLDIFVFLDGSLVGKLEIIYLRSSLSLIHMENRVIKDDPDIMIANLTVIPGPPDDSLTQLISGKYKLFLFPSSEDLLHVTGLLPE